MDLQKMQGRASALYLAGGGTYEQAVEYFEKELSAMSEEERRRCEEMLGMYFRSAKKIEE